MNGSAFPYERARVRELRQAMNAARLDYLSAQLHLKRLLGAADDCDRIERQISNLLNAARPKRARAAKE